MQRGPVAFGRLEPVCPHLRDADSVASMASAIGSRFPILQKREFRLLFLGTTFMHIGIGMMTVIQGIVAFDLTGKNSAVGLVALGTGATQVLIGLIGGALADRLPKRILLLGAQALIAVVYVISGALVLSGAITIPLLVLLTLTLGAIFAIMAPARQAWVADLLEGEELSTGMALTQTAMNAARIVGPFIVGALVGLSFVGSGGTYLVMAGLLTVAMLMTAGMSEVRAASVRRSLLGEIGMGLRYVWVTDEVRLLTMTFAAMIVAAMSYVVLLPGLVETELHHPPRDLGLAYGVTAVGAIAGNVMLTSRAGNASRRSIGIAGALTGCGLVALGMAPSFPLALLALFFVGACMAGFQLLNNVALVQRCAPDYYGRVLALTNMSFGLQAVASYPLGLLADGIGERSVLVACGCGAIAVAAVAVMLGRRVASAMLLPGAEAAAQPPV